MDILTSFPSARLSPNILIVQNLLATWPDCTFFTQYAQGRIWPTPDFMHIIRRACNDALRAVLRHTGSSPLCAHYLLWHL